MSKQERVRQILLYTLYITGACCMQVTFSQVFRLLGHTADLMLVLVVLCGYLFGTKDGIAVGLIVGVFRDYFSGPVLTGMDQKPVAVLGVGMLAFLYVGILSSILFRKRFRRKYTLGIIQVVIISIIYYSLGHFVSFAYLSISGNLESYYSLRYIVFSSIVPQIIVNVLASLPILFLLRFAGPYKKGVRAGLVDGYSVEDRKWQSI